MTDMIPQREFDNLYDTAATDENRNVMNREEGRTGPDLVVNSNYQNRASRRSSRYDSVEFTETSASYMDPLEDEDLLSGNTTPTVVGYYDGLEDYESRVYDPMNDMVIGRVPSPDTVKTPDLGKLPKSAFGLPDFFKNPVDLFVSCILLAGVIILEIIGLVALFA
ncbi:MAG: hypothetical protein J5685_11760 [Clostridiales bacterium]|nr:hypothetical protein [Clostridiales bacterium]